MIDLRPFQRRFLRAAFAPGIRTACLSLPRGNGKSHLAAHVLARFMTPGDPWHVPGAESVLLSSSIEQCRIVFKATRAMLGEGTGYRFLDSATRCGITHTATGTRIRVHGSNSKTAFGLVNVPFVVWDEPGAAETVGGEALWDAIDTAQGKPGSPLKAILIGTLAPATSGFWHELVFDGSVGSVHVTALHGNPDTWDNWQTIRKANPLMALYPESRAVLLEERDKARADTRLKARFLSYRLNVPTEDESTVLLTAEEWQQAMSREVPARSNKRPVVGIDLGGGRAWSAAVAIWPNGRSEAVAVAPGIPSIAEQEKRDRVPGGTYQRLVDSGALQVAEGLHVQPVSQLVAMIRAKWGNPFDATCDRFRLPDLKDAAKGWKLKPRVTRWSESGEDIRALRKITKDGPLSCNPDSRLLLTASLSVAKVKPDDSGNVRMVKRGMNNTARDDVAAALVLAAGGA